MLRKSILILFVLVAFGANANMEPIENPMDNFISEQIESLELELELFGTPINDGIVNIQSINVYELEEEFNFNSYLPNDFNPYVGMTPIKSQSICLK